MKKQRYRLVEEMRASFLGSEVSYVVQKRVFGFWWIIYCYPDSYEEGRRLVLQLVARDNTRVARRVVS